MQADDLTAIEPFLGTLMAGLKPAARRKLATAIGRLLRRKNALRIARNVDPDGAAMEPRKPRRERGGNVRKKGKMFPKLRRARAFSIKASADGVEIGFESPQVAATASVHQFGDVGYVGRKPDGSIVRTRYPQRRLLGFGQGDMDDVMDLVLDHVGAK